MSEDKQKYKARKEKLNPAGFETPNYTQIPNDFFVMMEGDGMTEAELRVTLVMMRQTFGFHRQAFKMSVGKLADAAGLSRNSVITGAEAAERRGTFRRTNPDTQGEAEWELIVKETPSKFAPPSTIEHPPLNGCIPPPQPLHTPPSTVEGQVALKENIKQNTKERIKENAEKQFLDPVTEELNFAHSKSAELQISLDIESKLKMQLGLNATSTKGGMEFVNYAVKRHKEGEDFQRFLDWWKVNGGDRKYWSFNKMRENWPAAFMDEANRAAVVKGVFYA